MIGLWGEHAAGFLLAWTALTVVAFALPMVVVPLAWGRAMRFAIPAQTDLAVYFGRCLGSIALVVLALSLRAALTGVGIVFVFELGLAFSVLMVAVHVYGALKGIQPITETIEIAFWALAVVLHVVFFPVASTT